VEILHGEDNPGHGEFEVDESNGRGREGPVFRLTRVPDWGVTRMGTGTRVLRGYTCSGCPLTVRRFDRPRVSGV
jgi:hypothetical protein